MSAEGSRTKGRQRKEEGKERRKRGRDKGKKKGRKAKSHPDSEQFFGGGGQKEKSL